MRSFSISRLPRIEFGRGVIARVPELVAGFGGRVLVVTGSDSFLGAPAWGAMSRDFRDRGIHWQTVKVRGEPSPELVDDAVRHHRGDAFDVVLGVGGGSALDAAKAIAGLLKTGRSVMDHLEGVGPGLPYEGPAVPFIAVPTTAGTGSEATRNAVLSRQGPEGFKKSFRHERLVAEYAIVDPELLATCPPAIIAANGMDALTQLLESYVSLRANAFTDPLAVGGMRAVRDGLASWYLGDGEPAAARERMAYAALASGVTLAQTGLGSVHGLASPLGAFFPIPHGVVCGTLVAAATETNIRAMMEREPDNPALDKYARAAQVMTRWRFRDREEAWDRLISLLSDLTSQLELPRLSRYGVTEGDLDRVVANARGASMKTNPIVLTDDEIRAIVRRCL